MHTPPDCVQSLPQPKGQIWVSGSHNYVPLGTFSSKKLTFVQFLLQGWYSVGCGTQAFVLPGFY